MRCRDWVDESGDVEDLEFRRDEDRERRDVLGNIP